MQQRSPNEKQKLSRTSFLALFSQCPGAVLPTFAVAHLLPLIHITVTVLALTTVSNTMAAPHFNFSKAASFQYAVPTPSFWKNFSLQLLLLLQGSFGTSSPWSHLPMHTVCLWVYPWCSPAVTSSCKHLGWRTPLEILKQVVGSVWVLVEVTLMQAALWKATSFPFPSSFWLLYSRSNPAENDPAWKRDSASNQLYPFLQLSGMEQGEILSSVAWGRSCRFFGWLKQVVWLHPELGRHSWPVFCHCFLISRLSLGSYCLHPSPLFHYSM